MVRIPGVEDTKVVGGALLYRNTHFISVLLCMC